MIISRLLMDYCSLDHAYGFLIHSQHLQHHHLLVSIIAIPAEVTEKQVQCYGAHKEN